MKNIYFTPGPSELYFTFEEHFKKALKEQIGSISHRSVEFSKIYQQTEGNLRTLLNLPEDYHIGFTTSATEVWERISENLIERNSFHLVNGDFSEKFYQTVKALNKNAISIQSELGTCSDISTLEIPEQAELIALAQNETSTGAAMPLEDIYLLRGKYPDKLLTIDAVSSLPVIDLNFNMVDSVYCSVQKCFGMPAGLGIWIYNDRCLEKTQRLKDKGVFHDTYHSMLNIHKFGKKQQTPCTPNVLYIYLLGEVVNDMLLKGMDMIRRESKYKAALLYNLFDSHKRLSSFVKEKNHRSLTVATAEVKGGSENLIKKLNEKGMVIGKGYGAFKESQMRIASFPTHSKEQVELLVDTVGGIEF
ncbi:MAG: phosphoserine aminotransferase [Cyclobacteriaceae bacterium]|jgi:phosphoserine aminotransferase